MHAIANLCIRGVKGLVGLPGLTGLAGTAGVIGMAAGWWCGWPLLVGVGAVTLVYAFWRWGLSWRQQALSQVAAGHAKASTSPAVAAGQPADIDNLDSLVEQMMAQGRNALLLRPQIARKLSDAQFHAALEALENDMALVPDGEVLLEPLDDPWEGGRLDEESLHANRERVVRVGHFFLDRYPVTNRQFAAFVAAGAYTQMGLWDPSIWSAVLEFVDQSGEPGPRFWRHGACEPGLEDHPVVGVSWYEAAAYARWLGKRLPTDAEWVKAASWPVTLAPTSRVQHKYPWGDTMDLGRVNLWASGHGRTVAVTAYSGGASVGGVHQLIGNVWEWMRGDFHGRDSTHAMLQSDSLIKSIRGGAFDTYFDNQATCQFQSGELALSRPPNVGFRCAASICDLLLARDAPTSEPSADEEQRADDMLDDDVLGGESPEDHTPAEAAEASLEGAQS